MQILNDLLQLITTIPGSAIFIALVSITLALVSIWDHDLYLTSRAAMKYALLLLFLGSILTVLLIIHLISKRFVGPFKRLIHGLRKTAEGELYYMIETSTDRELEQLSDSFNTMSRQLWDKQQRLKKSNVQLEEINSNWKLSKRYIPSIGDDQRKSMMEQWKKAVKRSTNWIDSE